MPEELGLPHTSTYNGDCILALSASDIDHTKANS